MPYPILKLPYALQKRLRSLANSKERYNLQIAIGYEKNYLGPLQKCINLHNEWLDFRVVEGQNILAYTNMQKNVGEDVVVVAQKILYIHDIDGFDRDASIYDNVVINCKIVYFRNSKPITAADLHYLSTKCNFNAVKKLLISRGCTASMKVILNLFKNIHTVSLLKNSAYKNWLQDALISKKRGMTQLDIGGSFKELFSFTPAELTEFYDLQDVSFNVMLQCSNSPRDAVELIRKKFGSHYEKIEMADGRKAGVLWINLFGNEKRMWFQVKRHR